jgi:peptide/nickel transport system substrate-binding protein
MVGRPAGEEALSYGMAEGISTPAHDDLIPEEVHTRMLKKRSLWSVGVGALVLMTMLFAACGPSNSTPPPSNIVKGGTVINGLYEEPDTLLPELTNETYSVIVDQALWAPLWYGDNQGVLHSGIAELPTSSNGLISSDLTTVTIKLKPGLKWSDGSPLTADDVVFSYNLYANPDFANTQGFPTTDPADPIGFVGATKVDDTTAKLTFKHPYAPSLSQLADGVSSVVPAKVFSSVKVADIGKSPENFKPSVTSGPFKLSDRVQGDHITLVPNPNYYQAGKPYLGQLTYKIIPDQNTILTALQSGTITESWFLDVTKQDAYKAIQGYTTASDANPAGYELLVFNLQNPILSDINVRKALTMSFNPQDLITQLYKGAAKPTCDDHSGTAFHEASLTDCYKYDVAGAKQLLDSAGWAMGSDGYRHKGGKTLELRYSTTNKASRKATQLLAQDAWKSVGIKIDLKNYAANVFFGANAQGILHSGNFDIGEFMNTVSYDPDDHTVYMSTQTPDKGGSNYMHYSNPQVDAAEQAQQSTADISARKAAFHTIDTAVIADVPVFYLYAPGNIFCYSNKLHNYMPSPLSASEGWNVWDWWMSK